MKLRVPKKAVIFLALIIIGVFVFILSDSEKYLPGGNSREEIKSDKSEPASQIRSPDSAAWQKGDFLIDVLDEDLESGLDTNSCRYKILSYESNGAEHSSGWQNRKCNSPFLISVGEGKGCRFEGEKFCWVFVSSSDKAANLHLPAEEKGSVKYYNIDWTVPQVGKAIIEEKNVKVSVSDNFKITGCNLYFNGEGLGSMSFSNPGCQKECLISKEVNLNLEAGENKIFAVCRDAAGNYGRGEELIIKENLPPIISACRVAPNQGNISSEFKFEIEASDPDGDSLIYNWDFGDSETSEGKNPSHQYAQSRTFEPKITVSDGRGGEDTCATAWVVVGE